METILRGLSMLVIAAILGMVVRPYHGAYGVMLSLAACVAAVLLAVRFLEPTLKVAEQLREMSGLSPAVTAPAVKIAGIGVLGQCTVGVCEDAGEKALAKTAEILTSACCVYLSLPLLQAVMDLLEHLLGG